MTVGAMQPQAQLDAWLHASGEDLAPITVDFREVAGFRSGVDRATHLLHPYPAKLLLNIPYFFLRCGTLAPKGARVLDPFCGSGTVLVESALAGVCADGADSNPLARLLTAAKTTPISRASIVAQLEIVVRSMPSEAEAPAGIINLDHWFLPVVTAQLARIKAAIDQVEAPEIKTFFLVCFSACVKRSSLADPRLSVPVRLNPERRHLYGANGEAALRKFDKLASLDVLELFKSVVIQNAERVDRFTSLRATTHVGTVFEDARSIPKPNGFYDLVLTSPPYLGAQKYVRASSLSLGWLGLTPNGTTRPFERVSIGREHISQNEKSDFASTGLPDADALIEDIQTRNMLRAHIASVYLKEMAKSFQEMARVTKSGGHLVLVIGANLIAGRPFPTPAFLSEIAVRQGFQPILHLEDTIRSRGLMTKRNKSAGLIDQESIFVFRRD